MQCSKEEKYINLQLTVRRNLNMMAQIEYV